MADTVQQIGSWAVRNLKYWEQAALERIITGGNLSGSGVKQLMSYFLRDAGLEPTPTDRPALSYKDREVAEPELAPCKLERIFNLRNVNALPTEQEIKFGPQLTLIYGDNGAGKSGYARALACIGFARGERDVLPNMDVPESKGVPQADLDISFSGTTTTVAWKKGTPCTDVHGLYVFEGTSLSAHLNQPNPINFSPFGLSYLTQLVEVTDDIRSRVKQLINERVQPHSLQPLFEGDTEVGKFVSALNADTDLRQLESFAALTDTDETKIQELDKRVAELKLQDIPQQIQRRRQEITDLQNLNAFIEEAKTGLGDTATAEALRLVEEFQARREELTASGADQFRSDNFTQIGTAEWRAFISAAKALADAESRAEQVYPTAGDHCLLCQQLLSEEAISLIFKLWGFLKSDSQERFDRARTTSGARAIGLERISVNYFGPDSNVRRLLQSDAPLLISSIDAQMKALETRKQEMIDSLRSGEKRQLAPQIDVDLTDLQRLIRVRQDDISSLSQSDIGKQLREAEAALRLLKHRETLRQQMPIIREYIAGRKWAVKAERNLGSTKAITTEYNDLFKKLVTERYINTFSTLLNRFGPGIRVTVEARGLKGETVRQIVLRKQSTAQGFTVDRVLSDGEKKAVALADFLTEVTIDESSGAIVFDDPVTSLDNSWKKVFATCLAEEARTRQIIVFTHDLSFLYHLKNEAETYDLSAVSHWIRAENGKPGFVYAKNSPICERDYRSANIAREHYSEALKLPPERQQSALQQGFGALRTSYEAFVIFDLFREVVLRFGERVSFGRLKDIRIEDSILSDVIRRTEELSRYIDAHLHSDAMMPTKPTLADLLNEIEAFEAIRKRHKELPGKTEIRQKQSSDPGEE